jgi:hypothetical protein
MTIYPAPKSETYGFNPYFLTLKVMINEKRSAIIDCALLLIFEQQC